MTRLVILKREGEREGEGEEEEEGGGGGGREGGKAERETIVKAERGSGDKRVNLLIFLCKSLERGRKD